MIPYGTLVNSAAIIFGGLLGTLFGKHIPKHIQNALPPVFGMSSIGIGIVSVMKLETLPVVVLSLIVGTIIGELFRFELRANKLVGKLGRFCADENRELILTLVALFAFSGTGIFGSLHAGMTDNHSILYTKSILDFFTAFSFAAILGFIIILIAVPQFILQLALFLFAWLVLDEIPAIMIGNFQAVGGLITIAIGLKILKIKELDVINMLPGLALVFPFTSLWDKLM